MSDRPEVIVGAVVRATNNRFQPIGRVVSTRRGLHAVAFAGSTQIQIAKVMDALNRAIAVERAA